MEAAVTEIDIQDPEIYAKGVPWGAYATLRREDPIHWNAERNGSGFWAVMRHTDIVEVSRQPKLFSSARENGGHRIFNENEAGVAGTGESAIGVPFISRDPPSHVQYRKFVMPAVAPGKLEGIEGRIRDRAQRLVDAIPLGESVDLVQTLSAPLPLMTLAELLAVPSEMWRDLYHWTNAFVGEDDPDFRQSPEAMQRTLSEFMQFATELFEARRRDPGGDIASLLANTEIDGQAIRLPEFIGNLILVLVGGNETTRNSLSHTVRAFAEYPAEWERLQTDRSLIVGAPAEMVRYSSPVLHMRRTAMEDTTIGTQSIKKGDKVVLWYASGNRDQQVFTEPDRFDIARNARNHVGFGTGQHVCVGSRLAEMQLRVAFGLLADRVRSFEVIGEPRRFRSNFINGLKNLDVILHPA